MSENKNPLISTTNKIQGPDLSGHHLPYNPKFLPKARELR